MSGAGRLVLLGVLLAGFAVPLIGLAESFLTFHPTRQYFGLHVARAQYVEGRNHHPASMLRAVEANGRQQQLEPRLLEAAVAMGYRILGGERIWLGGALSSLLWVLGGACLFLIARRLASDLAAGVALGLYLFLPYSVMASRSFQPDPAMVAALLAAFLAIVRHHARPSGTALLLAGGLSRARLRRQAHVGVRDRRRVRSLRSEAAWIPSRRDTAGLGGVLRRRSSARDHLLRIRRSRQEVVGGQRRDELHSA